MCAFRFSKIDTSYKNRRIELNLSYYFYCYIIIIFLISETFHYSFIILLWYYTSFIRQLLFTRFVVLFACYFYVASKALFYLMSMIMVAVLSKLNVNSLNYRVFYTRSLTVYRREFINMIRNNKFNKRKAFMFI